MATLAQVYTRIASDLDRDDIGSGGDSEQAKIDAVARAVRLYKFHEFWFNRASGTGATTAADATLAIPTGVCVPKVVSYDGEVLQRVPLEEIEYRTETGVPTHWAENEEQIQLWPVPDAAYTITVSGTADIDVPAASGDSNIWTTEGEDLIVAEAKMNLCRGAFRDPAGFAMAKDERDDALWALQRETRKRGASRLKSDIQTTETFNINRGY